MLIALSAIFLVPLIFMILTSFMTDNQAITPEIWPQPFQPKNYADVFHTIPFFRYTFNTMTSRSCRRSGIVLSSIPVAYALSRMRWRGRQAAFVVILAHPDAPVSGDGASRCTSCSPDSAGSVR